MLTHATVNLKKLVKASNKTKRATPAQLQGLARGVVRVGQGRGFVVKTADGTGLIITAAHCLTLDKDGRLILPPPHGTAHFEDLTYPTLVAPLRKAPAIWVQCLFVNPVADIAVLGEPDEQSLFEEWEQYDALVTNSRAFSVSDAPERGRGWALAKAAREKWLECELKREGDGLLVVSGLEFSPGMSGSPILAEDGSAVGVVSTGSNNQIRYGTPNPRLARDLPGWLLRAVNLGTLGSRH